MEICGHDGCESVGVFADEVAGDDGATRAVVFCFEHRRGDVVVAVEPDATGFRVDVTAGFASMILEHTAMSMLDEPDATKAAMDSLEANTGFTADVCAGLLLATTWIAAAGQVDDDMLMRGAELYEAEADGDGAELEPDPVDDDTTRCEARNPTDGEPCDLDVGHDGDHYASDADERWNDDEVAAEVDDVDEVGALIDGANRLGTFDPVTAGDDTNGDAGDAGADGPSAATAVEVNESEGASND